MIRALDAYIQIDGDCWCLVIEPDAERGEWVVRFPQARRIKARGSSLETAIENGTEAVRVWIEQQRQQKQRAKGTA